MLSRLALSVGARWPPQRRSVAFDAPPPVTCAAGPSRRGRKAASTKAPGGRNKLDTQNVGVEAPCVFDLKAGAPPGGRERLWRDVQSWVVFSDLHVSAASLDTSLRALRAVKEEASRRNAGVLFLGDFWHHRGSLPVEPLNAILDEFVDWTAPTLMLVGNHDQVTAGGMLHALAPLQLCAPCIHVFEQPTVFMDALWLPYRRDPNVLSEAVCAAGDVKAVFAHVDVVGAYMNETFQARDGLQPQLFPNHIPTFTGHYHRRHTVEGTNIHYVGSPYQVSRSEAGQEKALTVLDAGWQPVEVVPLDVGPRHFFVSGLRDTADGDAPRPPVRKGDRVRVQLADQSPSAEEQQVIDEMLTGGARVEVVAAPVAAKARITEAEQLGPVPLFHKYAEATQLSRGAVAMAVAVLQGLDSVGGGAHLELELHQLELKGFGPFVEPLQYGLKGRGLQVLVGRNLDDEGSDSNGAGKTALAMAPLWVLTGKLDGGRDGGGGRAATHADIVSDSAKSASGKVEGVINSKPFVVERAVNRRALSKLKFTLDGKDETQADSRMTQALIEQELGTALLMRTGFFNQNAVASLLDASDKDFKLELGKVVDLDIWDIAKDRTAGMLKDKKRLVDNLTGEVSAASSMLQRLQAQMQESGEQSAEWDRDNVQRIKGIAKEMDLRVRSMRSCVSTGLNLANRLEHWVGNSPLLSDIGNEKTHRRRKDATVQAEVAAAEARISEGERTEAGISEAGTKLQSQYEALGETLRKAEISAARRKGKVSVAEKQLNEYASLKGQSRGERAAGLKGAELSHSHSDEGGERLTCDRCLQPIDSEKFASNLNRMKAELASAREDSEAASEEAQRLKGNVSELRARLTSLTHQLGEARRGVQSAHEALRRARERELREEMAAERHAAEVTSLSSACRETAAQVRQSISNLSGYLEGSEYLDVLQDTIQSADSLFKVAANDATEMSLEKAQHAQREGRHALTDLERQQRALLQHKQQLSLASATENPFVMELARLKQLSSETEQSLKAKQSELRSVGTEIESLTEVDKAFGRSGIPSFVLEGALAELQGLSATYLEGMSNTFSLTLSPTKSATRNGAKAASEQITKMVQVRLPGGEIVNRSLRQLSGGERRRVALALGLGFSELASRRGRFKSNVLVLDEVLQHLDNQGCAAVATVLRSLSQDTILLIGQDNTFATESFDAIDVVTKEGGSSRVEARSIGV